MSMFVIDPYRFGSASTPAFFSDDFNRGFGPDTDIGSDWAEVTGDAEIYNNELSSSGGTFSEVYPVTEFADDHYAECDVTVIGSNNGTVQLYVRSDANGAFSGLTCYAARFIHHSTGAWQIYRVISGSVTTVANVAGSRTIPYRMRLEVLDEGGDVRVNLYDSTSGDVLKATYLDTSGSKITSGSRVGVRLDHFSTGRVSIDNFEAGDL